MSFQFFPSRRRFLAASAGLSLGLILGGSGCGRETSWSEVEGQWLDQDRDQHLELTPSRLAVEVVRAPGQVAAYKVDSSANRLSLQPVVDAWPGSNQELKRTDWDFSLNGPLLTVQTKARVWELKKAAVTARPILSLTGLWRQVREDQKVDYFEFTPWATLVAVTWQPSSLEGDESPKASELIPTADWWAYQTDEDNRLKLAGVTRDSSQAKTAGQYSISANTLTLHLGDRAYTLRRTDRIEA